MLKVTDLSKESTAARAPCVLSDVSLDGARRRRGDHGCRRARARCSTSRRLAPSSGTVTPRGPFQLSATVAAFATRRSGSLQDHCRCRTALRTLIPTLVPLAEAAKPRRRSRGVSRRSAWVDRIDHRPAGLGRRAAAHASRAWSAPAPAALRRADWQSRPRGGDNVVRAPGSSCRKQTILIVVTHSAQSAEKPPVRYEPPMPAQRQ